VSAVSFSQHLAETGRKFEAARAAADNDEPMEALSSFRRGLLRRRLLSF
jgi:hypothetical protein